MDESSIIKKECERIWNSYWVNNPQRKAWWELVDTTFIRIKKRQDKKKKSEKVKE